MKGFLQSLELALRASILTREGRWQEAVKLYK